MHEKHAAEINKSIALIEELHTANQQLRHQVEVQARYIADLEAELKRKEAELQAAVARARRGGGERRED